MTSDKTCLLYKQLDNIDVALNNCESFNKDGLCLKCNTGFGIYTYTLEVEGVDIVYNACAIIDNCSTYYDDISSGTITEKV